MAIYQTLHCLPQKNIQSGSTRIQTFIILLGTNTQQELGLPHWPPLFYFLRTLIIKETELVKRDKATETRGRRPQEE